MSYVESKYAISLALAALVYEILNNAIYAIYEIRRLKQTQATRSDIANCKNAIGVLLGKLLGELFF